MGISYRKESIDFELNGVCFVMPYTISNKKHVNNYVPYVYIYIFLGMDVKPISTRFCIILIFLSK